MIRVIPTLIIKDLSFPNPYHKPIKFKACIKNQSRSFWSDEYKLHSKRESAISSSLFSNKPSLYYDAVSQEKAGDRKEFNVNGVIFAVRYIPPGTFMMGIYPSEHWSIYSAASAESPLHKVTLTKGFWMMETQVTQALVNGK